MKLRTVIQIGADGKQAARVFAGLKEDANELDEAGERAGLSFSKAAQSMGDMPGPLGAAAGFMTGPAGLVAGAGALGAGLFAAANSAAEAAVEVGTLAELTSTTTEEASRLVAVFNKAGVESKDLSDIMLQTAGVLADDADLAERLGVNIEAGATSATVFQQAVDAWRLTDELERGVLGAKLFGEEGVRQMSSVIKRVDDLGVAMEDVDEKVLFTDSDVDQAIDYENAMADVSESFEGLAISVGQQAVPALTSFARLLELGTNVGLLNAEELKTDFITIAEAAEIADEQTRAYWENFSAERGGKVVRTFNDISAATEAAAKAIEAADARTAEWEAEVDRVETAFRELRTEVNRDQMLRDLDEQFDELRGAAWEYAAAVIEGSDDAVEAEGKYQDALDDTKLDIIGVGEELGLLPEDIETVLTLTDNGSIDATEERLKELVRQREAKIQAVLVGTPGDNTPPSANERSAAPSTVVNVTMHGQASSREMANAVAQWTANG